MKRIVIIEDDDAIADVLVILLKRNGYIPVQHHDGTSIIKAEDEQADLYMIDRQLPGVDGLELCRMLKSDQGTKNIPVIIFSASPHVNNQAIKAGADRFVEKPFSNTHILTMLKELLPN